MKKTVLDDNASIYQKREEESEKQKWERMDKKQKAGYFLDYYLLKIIVGILLSILIIFLIWSVVRPKPETVLGIAIVDEQLAEQPKENFLEELRLLCTTDKREEILLDDTVYLRDGGLDKLQIYLYNQQLDVIIADQTVFQKLAGYGYFQDLQDFLDQREISDYRDRFVYAAGPEEENLQETGQSEKEDQKDTTAYGLDISGSERFKEMEQYLENPVLGIAANARNRANIEKLMRCLLP